MADSTKAPKARRVRLLRSVLVKGDHVEKGSVIEAPAGMAASLVQDGSAEWDESDASDALPTREPLVMSPNDEVRIVSSPAAAHAPERPAATPKGK